MLNRANIWTTIVDLDNLCLRFVDFFGNLAWSPWTVRSVAQCGRLPGAILHSLRPGLPLGFLWGFSMEDRPVLLEDGVASAIAETTPSQLAALKLAVLRWTQAIETRPSDKIIERRLAIYDDLAPLLNDVLCYFTYLGCWNELDPPQLITVKRKIDNRLLLATPFFPPGFLAACRAFQHECFETVAGSQVEARLKTYHRYREQFHHVAWNEDWNICFSEQQADPAHLEALHQVLLAEYAKCLGPLDF